MSYSFGDYGSGGPDTPGLTRAAVEDGGYDCGPETMAQMFVAAAKPAWLQRNQKSDLYNGSWVVALVHYCGEVILGAKSDGCRPILETKCGSQMMSSWNSGHCQRCGAVVTLAKLEALPDAGKKARKTFSFLVGNE